MSNSATVILEGENCTTVAHRWVGTLQWNCPSPLRPKHPRKNWFIGVQQLTATKEIPGYEEEPGDVCQRTAG